MYRTIDCATWDDPWFAELAPDAKLLFLYLLTNWRARRDEYPITNRVIAFETGLDPVQVSEAMQALAPFVIWANPDFTAVQVYRRGVFVGEGARPPAQEWATLRTQVFARDDYTCRYCGVRGVALQCDHVVPISRGGTNDLDNLTTACRACNLAKHDKTPQEWQR